jgi:hypothetical protein
MSARRNGGIIGPQNRTTSVGALGVWHLDDVQESVQGRNWPGFTPIVPNPPAISSVTSTSNSITVTFSLGYNGGSSITSSTVVAVSGGVSYSATGSSPLTITGLPTNKVFTIYAYSTNSVGDSTYSYGPTTSTPYSINYLTIAGGGGGGCDWAGGGGAGGLLSGTTSLSPSTVYSVAVGAGGAGGTTNTVPGPNGTSSTFSSFTSVGGGGGAPAIIGNQAQSGGSGGGAGGATGTYSGGAGTSGQGNNGGGATGAGSGGGGGARAVGGAGSSSKGGDGGVGLSSSITGSSVYYAGGGGGGGYAPASISYGSGGTGGGGAGNATAGGAGVNGTSYTGGGGGGGAGAAGYGGSGGSGVVILSIPTTYYSGVTTGNPTVTTSGGNTILKFTGNGSYTA